MQSIPVNAVQSQTTGDQPAAVIVHWAHACLQNVGTLLTCCLVLIGMSVGLTTQSTVAQEQQDIAKQRSILEFGKGIGTLVPTNRPVIESADDPQSSAFVPPQPPVELRSEEQVESKDSWTQSSLPGANAKVSVESAGDSLPASSDQQTLTRDQDVSNGWETPAQGTFASNPAPQEGGRLLAPSVAENFGDGASDNFSDSSSRRPPVSLGDRQGLTAPPMQDSSFTNSPSFTSPFSSGEKSGGGLSNNLRPSSVQVTSEGAGSNPSRMSSNRTELIGDQIGDQVGDEFGNASSRPPSIPARLSGELGSSEPADMASRSEPIYDQSVRAASFQDNGFGATPPQFDQSRPMQSSGLPQPVMGQGNGFPAGDLSSQGQPSRRGFPASQPQRRQSTVAAVSAPMNTPQSPVDQAKELERQRLAQLSRALLPARNLIARYDLDNYQTYPGTPVSLEELMRQPISVQQREAMTHQYWETYYDWAALNVAREHQAWANSLQAGTQADIALVETARKSANDRVLAAEIQMGKSQSRLLDYFADARSDDFLPLPGDSPTVNPFKTDLATYRKIRAIPSSLRGIEQMLDGTTQLMVQRAATVNAAQRSRAEMQKAAMGRQATIASALVAAEMCFDAELDLVASVVNYNQAVGHYLLTMEPYRSPQQLVTWMIGKANQKTKRRSVVPLTPGQPLNPNGQPASSLAGAGQSILDASNFGQSSQAASTDAPITNLADLPLSSGASQAMGGGSRLAQGNGMQGNSGQVNSMQGGGMRGNANPVGQRAFSDNRQGFSGGQGIAGGPPQRPAGGFGGGFQGGPLVQPSSASRTAQDPSAGGNSFRR